MLSMFLSILDIFFFYLPVQVGGAVASLEADGTLKKVPNTLCNLEMLGNVAVDVAEQIPTINNTVIHNKYGTVSEKDGNRTVKERARVNSLAEEQNLMPVTTSSWTTNGVTRTATFTWDQHQSENNDSDEHHLEIDEINANPKFSNEAKVEITAGLSDRTSSQKSRKRKPVSRKKTLNPKRHKDCKGSLEEKIPVQEDIQVVVAPTNALSLLMSMSESKSSSDDASNKEVEIVSEKLGRKSSVRANFSNTQHPKVTTIVQSSKKKRKCSEMSQRKMSKNARSQDHETPRYLVTEAPHTVTHCNLPEPLREMKTKKASSIIDSFYKHNTHNVFTCQDNTSVEHNSSVNDSSLMLTHFEEDSRGALLDMPTLTTPSPLKNALPQKRSRKGVPRKRASPSDKFEEEVESYGITIV